MAPSRSLTTDTWLYEIAALVGSWLALLGVIIVLSYNDHKPIFEWHNLTLNTVISLLSTTSKALLLAAVASCLGQ